MSVPELHITHHKLALRLVRDNQAVYLEDLSLAGTAGIPAGHGREEVNCPKRNFLGHGTRCALDADHDGACEFPPGLFSASGPVVRIRTTQQVVSCLPADHIDHDTYAVTVEWRGDAQWAVLRGHWCLGRDGAWDFEPIPAEREDGWLAAHRFTEQEALRLAVEWAPKILSNGRTAAEVAAQAVARRGVT